MNMPKRPQLTHLLAIGFALAALAAAAWLYTNASDPVQGISEPPSSSPAQPSGTFSVYFPNSRMGSDEDCGKVFPVPRPTKGDVDLFGDLLEGPTEAEMAQGYSTAIPDGVRVLSSGVRGPGVTFFVDFSEEMESAAGSCRVIAIRAQIEQTVRTAVPEVDRVVISVDGGDPDEALQP